MSKISGLGHRLYSGQMSIDFIGRRRTWYVVSAIILLVSVGALLTRGLNLGIEFRGGADFLAQLRNLYRKVETAAANPVAGDQERLAARALRFQRRFAKVGTKREREFQKLRSHLMQEMAGRNLRGRLRLRPEGLVALEWARLAEA